MALSLGWLLPLALAFGCGLLLGGSWQRRRGSARREEPSRQQLLTWLDQAPLGWLVVDGRNRVRYINARAERQLRVQAAESQELRLSDISEERLLLDLVETIREHRQPQRMEWDQADQELEVFAFAGTQESVAILLQSRRSLEAQLVQQERWVSDVAHELKTPLTALLLVGDSLAGTVTDRNAVLVERLMKELRRMQDLVGDLLELSRLENLLPGEGIRTEAVVVGNLIAEAWQGVKPLADQKQVSLDLRLDPRVEQGVQLSGSRQRLHRALLNLLDNALRYSPEGGQIHVDMQANAYWLRITIRDEGPGLSEQDREHMFERFYRGDSSRFRRQRGGSGLGLAIVQQIIHAHGGSVFGENDPQGGARFELRLPLNPELSLRQGAGGLQNP